MEDDLKTRLIEAQATIIDMQAQIAVMGAMVVNLTRHYVTSQPGEMQEATLQGLNRVLSNLSSRTDSLDPGLLRHVNAVDRQIPIHAAALERQVRAQLKARN